MSKVLPTCLTLAIVLAAAPASASITIYSTPGAVQPDQNVLFHGLPPTGNSAFGVTNQTNNLVTFTGIEPLATFASGQARISALDEGLSQLSFALDAGLGFKEVEFNIFGTGATADEVTLSFTDQFGTVFSDTFGIGNGQNFFSARAFDEQLITLVSFTLNGDVQDARQFRIGGIQEIGVIPEPQTWALLLAGFGLVGVAMRRRKSMPSVTA